MKTYSPGRCGLDYKSLEQKLREGKLPRRDFLRILGKGAIGAAGLAVLGGCEACKNDGVTPTTYVSCSGIITGLLRGMGVSSGKITIDNAITIGITGSMYRINESDKVTQASHSVLIETNEGFPRRTTAVIDSRGMTHSKTKLAIDNVIEQNSGYDINTYNSFLAYAGSERWLSQAPRFFLYDKSLWHWDGSQMVVINSDYKIDNTLSSNVEYVVNSHVSQYTNNFAGGPLIRESSSSERPNPKNSPSGWIIYYVQDNAPWSISRAHRQNSGDIYYGEMAFQPGPRGVHGISIDTAQTLGIGQDANSGQILAGTEPSPLVREFISRIIYNRAPHHTMLGEVDTES
jgi:hypothetical protein